MQRQHVAILEQLLTAFGDTITIGARGFARMLAAPDQHLHAERLAVARQRPADLAVTPDAERLPVQYLAQTEVRRQRGRLQPGLLPGALLKVRYVLRNAALSGHDKCPRQLG